MSRAELNGVGSGEKQKKSMWIIDEWRSEGSRKNKSIKTKTKTKPNQTKPNETKRGKRLHKWNNNTQRHTPHTHTHRAMHTYTAKTWHAAIKENILLHTLRRVTREILFQLYSPVFSSLLGSASVSLELTEHKIIIRSQISAEIWTPSQFEADQEQLPLLLPLLPFETPWLPTAALGVVIKRKIEKQKAKNYEWGNGNSRRKARVKWKIM